jgi:hypothetical protein
MTRGRTELGKVRREDMDGGDTFPSAASPTFLYTSSTAWSVVAYIDYSLIGDQTWHFVLHRKTGTDSCNVDE